jgi:hypothetical protein
MSSGYEVSALSRIIWGLAALGVVVVLVLSALVLVGGPQRWIPASKECTATVGEETVELTTEQAEDAASVAARSVRLRLPMRTTAMAVADAIDSSDAEGRVVAVALTGRSPSALSCEHGGGVDEASANLGPAGLTGRASAVRRDLDRAFGTQQVGGFAPGGVSTGHMSGSAHYAGRAVDVFFRPINDRTRRRGWAVAHYLVAHADRLAVSTVIFDGHIWTARRADEGWRDYEVDTRGRPRSVAAVLEHRDHVHVDVFG